ncbi:MAG: LysR family transcriptional regulator [Hyphomicrobiales bacterium]
MLDTVKIFLKVVELGSFSQTAKVLNMAPSSIARAIDGLENDLQTTLFKRSTRKLILTDKGHLFLLGAGKLLADMDAIRSDLTDQKNEPQGRLRISAFETYGRLIICPLLPKFLEKYPHVSIEFELENRMCDLAAENIDIGIRIGTPVNSNLKSRILAPLETRVFAAPKYLRKHPKITEPKDLATHNCLTFTRDHVATYWHFERGNECEKIQVRGNLASKGGSVLLQTALAGLGVVLMSDWLVGKHVEQGQLMPCLEDWQASLSTGNKSQIYLVYQDATFPNPLVRLFIDFLIANI